LLRNPAEHLRLPTLDDVRDGLIASKIAAHIGDLEKGYAPAWARDREMDEARARLDWAGQQRAALDPETFAKYRESSVLTDETTCSMCGNLCAVKICSQAVKASS
jgi:phosphomethylpyrimidine synthase